MNGSLYSDRLYVYQLLRQMRLDSTIKVDFPLVESAARQERDAPGAVKDTEKAITAVAVKFGCTWRLDGKKIVFQRVEIKEDK